MHDIQGRGKEQQGSMAKAQVKIWYSNPYSTDGNIGKALNDFCELVPDGDWICLQDGDMMFLTPDWGKQIEEVVRLHGGKYSLIGCVTNRLGRPFQRVSDDLFHCHDMREHYAEADRRRSEMFAEVVDITSKRHIAGMLMLFPKSVWVKHKFKTGCITFDDEFSKAIVRSGGRLGIMTGLYVYHLYRIWSDAPGRSNQHLLQK